MQSLSKVFRGRPMAALVAALVGLSAAGSGVSVAAETPPVPEPALRELAPAATPPQPADAFAVYTWDFKVLTDAPSLPGYTLVEQLYDGATWTNASAGTTPTPLIFTHYRAAYKAGTTRGPWRETPFSARADAAPKSLRSSRDAAGINLSWNSPTNDGPDGWVIAWFGDGEWHYTNTVSNTASFSGSLELARVAPYRKISTEFIVTGPYAEIEPPTFGAVRDLAYRLDGSRVVITWERPWALRPNASFSYEVQGATKSGEWTALGRPVTRQYTLAAANSDIVHIRVRPISGGVRGDWAEITIDRSAVTEVAIGFGHACALVIDGTVKCWGFNRYGQLGRPAGTNAKRAKKVPGLTDIVDIDVGFFHTCAVDRQGKVWCWGFNEYGQLGDGTLAARDTPKVVPGVSGVVSLATGDGHTCVALTSGSVRCWGNNQSKQSGTNAAARQATPVAVPGVDDVIQISAGRDSTCAVSAVYPGAKSVRGRTSTNGIETSIHCWGSNARGALGNGGTTSSAAPTEVVGLRTDDYDYGQVAVGVEFACAATSSGAAERLGITVCWGAAEYGQLGQVEPASNQFERPILGASFGPRVKWVSAGGYHSCAVNYDDEVWCSGDDSQGQRGDGKAVGPSTSAGKVRGLSASMVDAGLYSTCAVDLQGDAWCWGTNDSYQLGDGSNKRRLAPAKVKGL